MFKLKKPVPSQNLRRADCASKGWRDAGRPSAARRSARLWSAASHLISGRCGGQHGAGVPRVGSGRDKTPLRLWFLVRGKQIFQATDTADISFFCRAVISILKQRSLHKMTKWQFVTFVKRQDLAKKLNTSPRYLLISWFDAFVAT